MRILLIDGDKQGLGGASRNLEKIKLLLNKDNKVDKLNIDLFHGKKKFIKKNQPYFFFLIIEIIKLFYDLYKIHKKLDFNYSPDIIFVKNYRLIPYLTLIKKQKVIFLCSGFSITENLSANNQDIYKYITVRKFLLSPYEYLSLVLSDKVISNSELNYQFMTSNLKFNKKNTFIFYTSEIIDEISEIESILPREKKIDILYTASDINRVEKNFNFSKSIMTSKKLFNLKKTIISTSNIDNFDDNTSIMFYQNKTDFYKTLNKSKIIIIPSKFDSSPNVFYEAIYNYCIPIVSKNCGVKHFDQRLTLNINLIDEWNELIIKVLNEYEYFYDNLLIYRNKLLENQSKIKFNFNKIIKNEH